MIGPVVKIDPAVAAASRRTSTTSGRSRTRSCRAYIAGWDVALLPFARNEATRFISPTKTPEYLAAGKPVVSTSIRDVVRPYGEQGLVRIADDVGGVRRARARRRWPRTRRRACAQADAFLRADVVGRHVDPHVAAASTRRSTAARRRRSAPAAARAAAADRRARRRRSKGGAHVRLSGRRRRLRRERCSPSGWRRTPARRC